MATANKAAKAKAAKAPAPATAQAMPTLATLPPATVTPAVQPLPTVVSLCGQHVAAAPNVVRRAATLGNVPAAMASVVLVAGKPCKVRVPYTMQAMQAILGHIAQHGPATAATLASVANGDMVRYAVRSGWLVPAPQVA